MRDALRRDERVDPARRAGEEVSGAGDVEVPRRLIRGDALGEQVGRSGGDLLELVVGEREHHVHAASRTEAKLLAMTARTRSASLSSLLLPSLTRCVTPSVVAEGV